jgi:hypothetical protein
VTYVEVQPLAEQELAEAAGWYEEQAPGVGLEFLRAVDATFAAIGREPSMFPHGVPRPSACLVETVPK